MNFLKASTSNIINLIFDFLIQVYDSFYNKSKCFLQKFSLCDFQGQKSFPKFIGLSACVAVVVITEKR